MNTKILKFNELFKYKSCVLTYGHFSTIHPGHIRYLKYAKDFGEFLITAILSDEFDGNVEKYPFNQKERAESLAMLDMVDGIYLLNKDKNSLCKLIEKIEPKLLILGKEFEKSKEKNIINAINLLKGKGIATKFHAGEIQYANTNLLEASEKDLANKQKEKFRIACKKQKINLDKLIDSIDLWNSTHLIVLGDTIIDQYSACEAMGMSAEAPVIVVKELNNKNFIGGAAIVASHIRALGAKCDFISVVGSDEMASFARDELFKKDIKSFLIEDKSRPTTFKKRYVVANQKLFRVSRLEEHRISEDIENKIIKYLDENARHTNGIVISDFVYGIITNKIVRKIVSLSQKYNLMIFGDLQCSSQIGSILKFKNFSLLCPNEREARLSLMDKISGLEKLSQDLITKTLTKRLIMKLGDGGFIAYDRNKNDKVISQSFPALSVNPVDVTGAGDSLLAVMASGLSSKQSMMGTSAIGCCMASLAVGRMGNTPIKAEELKNHLKSQLL